MTEIRISDRMWLTSSCSEEQCLYQKLKPERSGSPVARDLIGFARLRSTRVNEGPRELMGGETHAPDDLRAHGAVVVGCDYCVYVGRVDPYSAAAGDRFSAHQNAPRSSFRLKSSLLRSARRMPTSSPHSLHGASRAGRSLSSSLPG